MELQGETHPQFRDVERTFRRRLAESEGGGAVTVFHRGEKVVDLWGGRRDPSGATWQRHTPSLSFSTTKGVTATALHVCVDRGLLGYDDPVAKHWPEFAQAGKSAITVRQLLSHEAGLYDVRRTLSAGDLLDWDRATAKLAAAAPAHEPGRYNAYHALTFGYLVGELVRRVSGVHLRDFVRDELAGPLELDHLHVGAPQDAIDSAARYFPLRGEGPAMRGARGKSPRARAIAMGLSVARRIGVPADPARSARALLPKGIEAFDWSSDESMAACNPSASGLFTARALARLYATLGAGGSLGGRRLMRESSVRAATRVQNRRLDGVLLVPMTWRLGYHSIFSRRGMHRGAFGHFGFRGSGAFADPKRELAVAYVTNCGVGSPIGDGRIFELGGVAAACAEK